MKATFLLGSLHLLFATCSGAPAPSPEAEGQLRQARQLLAEDDPDGALAITDDLRKAWPEWAAMLVVAGDGNMKLSTLDRRGLNAQAVLADAETSYLRATEMEPDLAIAWKGLAEARYQLADYDGVRLAAGKALELASTKPGNEGVVGPSSLAAARACMQQFTAMRQAELGGGERDERDVVPVAEKTAAKAQEALSHYAICQRALPAEGYQGAATVYQWLGANDEALKELERGVLALPENADLHVAYQDLHMQLGQQRALSGAYARLVRENPSQPLMLWFQGRAQVIVADDLRTRQSMQAAIDAYRKAIRCYRDFVEKSPGQAAPASEWIAICELSIARTRGDMGDVQGATEHLFLAIEASKKTLAYDGLEPQLRDSFGSHFAGVVFALGKTLSASVDAKGLEQTIAFYDSIITKCPGMFGFIYNNAALPCRDLGVLRMRDIESMQPAHREKAMTEAMALWEKSYRYYEEAVKLSPDDARIVNDCGLMLIYHLNRDFGRARELFERAIAVGQPQLDALPQGASADERQSLEESIGDAWQNIAVLMAKHQNRPFAELKPFLEKAVTFYPYRQREAAQMLQNEGKGGDAPRLNPRSLQGSATGAGADQDQGNAKDKSEAAKAKAEAAAKDGDLDSALAELDKANRELKDYGPFQAIRGDYALRYARAALAEGRKGADMLFADAVSILKRAVELDSDPSLPRLWLAESQYEAGELADAQRTTSALLLHMQSQGGGDEAVVAAAHRLRANAASRHYMANKDDSASKAALDDARLSFRFLEQKKQLNGEARRTWSTMEQWAEAGAGAVGVYARALTDNKDDQALMNAIVDTAYAVGEPALAVDALKDRADGTGLWYLGRAHFLSASSMRAGGKLDEAMAELDLAKSVFEKSMKDNATFADSCQQWIAICIGKQGNVAIAKKDWQGAEKLLLESVRARPDRINDDLGLQETTKIGVMLVADHYARQGDLGKTESIYRAAVAAANSDLDLLNNEGLFARDHGNALERAGKKKEAMELYEHSYKAYSRAAELDATNVRLLNDRALIAIHYLERDWDENKKILDRAILLGEQQMQGFPAADPQGKQTLDEALGDAYENLALWHLKHDSDAAKAKAAAEQSMLHHPGKGRPGARRHLQEAEKLLPGGK